MNNMREGAIDVSDLKYSSSPDAERLLLRLNDVLFNRTNSIEHVGRTSLWRGELDRASFASYIVRLFPDVTRLDPEYLVRWLNLPGVQLAIRRFATPGVHQVNINPTNLRRVEILLPENLREQRRIAEVLSTLDEAIEQTEALTAKYQQIKAGLMHDLFTCGVTPDGRLRATRAEAPHLYKESLVGWIPREWSVVSVRECGSVQLGRQRSPDQMSGRWTTPYLRVANIFDGYIDYSDVLEMDFTPDERRTFSVRRGDILLNEGQSLALVGRCSMYEEADEKFSFQNTLVRFRVFDKQSPLFYGFLFKWFLDRGLFMRIAKQTTSVAHLGADRFARMNCISVPYGEQLRIGERLHVARSFIDENATLVAKLRRLKLGLMHDLLTGRVRVPLAGAAT